MTPSPPDPLAAVVYLLRQQIGLEPGALGPDRIARAVGARRASRGQDAVAYLRLLAQSEDELRALVDEVVVPETWFFRDRVAFRCLRGQAVTPRPTAQRFRVLSVPCATGEEPYSIAMSILDAGLGAGDFEVVATDVSPAALAAAAAGSYAELAFRERAAEFLALRDRFCLRAGAGYLVAEPVRAAVRFVRANLAAPQFLPAEAPFHAVFCRNLFIYLDQSARRTALVHLRRLLLPGGALYLSAVEAGTLGDAGFRRLGEEFPFVFTPVAANEGPAPAPRPSRKPPTRTEPVVSRTAPKPCPQAAEVTDALAKARQAADAGRLDEAASLCAALAARESPRADVICLLGVVRQAQGDFAEAERCFQRALYLEPRHGEALVHMALLARRRGDERLAENFLRRLDKSV